MSNLEELLGEAVIQNFMQSIVTDAARVNADFHYKAGLNPKIVRKASHGCCKWCTQQAGTYNYENVYETGNDVYRRHKGCKCTVEYDPGTGKVQNVHSKTYRELGTKEKIEKRKSIGLDEASADVTEARKTVGLDEASATWDGVTVRSTEAIQNGFSAFPQGEPIAEYVKKVKPLDGYFDVAMHGSQNAVAFGSRTANLSARELAEYIKHHDGYNGEDIRLLSCSTGKIENDNICFAEELSTNLGVKVTAPNDTLYISSTGNLTVGDKGKGSFVEFKPNQRSRKK